MDRARAQRLPWVEPLRQLLRLDRGGHSATRSWCMCCAKRPVLSIALRRTGLSCCIRWRLGRSGESRIDMLIDDVQNDRHVHAMASIDEAPQAVRPTKMSAGRKVVERPIPPIEVQLRTGDGHQFQAVDAETLEIGEPINDAVKVVVEFLDLHFINDQVIKLRRFIRVIGPGNGRGVSRKHDRREKSNIGLPRKWVREPARNELPLAPRRRPPELKAVQIKSFGTEMCR